MPKRVKQKPILTPGRKKALIGVAAAIVVWLSADAIFGTAIRVGSAVRALEAGEENAELGIRNLGTRCADQLESQLLAGDREFDKQAYLSEILLLQPFYMMKAVRKALNSEDPVVSRGAVLAMLSQGADPGQPAVRIDDDVLAALAQWCGDRADRYLAECLTRLPAYHDPRLGELLVKVAAEPSIVDDLAASRRVEETRYRALSQLAPYASQPKVVEGMRAILDRKGESDRIVRKAVATLTAGGFRDDPAVYWAAARSDNPHVRQSVADNLRNVRDPKILPILELLLGDPNETVRRAAVGTLMEKRSSILMSEADYLAEDWYQDIKVDLAMSVGLLRDRNRMPFLVWCLEDFDPQVVRIAHWELVRMTKTKAHFGFTKEQWQAHLRANTIERSNQIKEILNDEFRREQMITGFAKMFPPRKTDRDRVPHLIRHLTHRDTRNVERAMKELVRITGRREGFPEALLDPAATPEDKGVASVTFLDSDRAALAAEWQAWWKTQEK
jgi:hypothetical protein